MTHISITELRQNLSRYLDEAIETGVPIVVTLEDGKANIVVVSEAEFAGWQETAYLLSNPHNAERLLHDVRNADPPMPPDRELPPPQATADP
jgi:antitoxin YefM